MADKEKVLPDPVEIEGIRIGDDRFKIKGGLDLNRRVETIEGAEEDFSIAGIGSIARSPKKDNLIEKAVAKGINSISLGEGSISLGKDSLAIGTYAVAQGDNSISIYNRKNISDLEKKYLTGEKTFYVNTTHTGGELSIAPLTRIRDILFTPYDNENILKNFKPYFGKNKRNFRDGVAYGNNSISLCGGMAAQENSIAIGEDCVSVGYGSLSFGRAASACGSYSIALGDHTAALGNWCFSEGVHTLSTSYNTGDNSHAEGRSTTSIDGSHSEGVKTEAYLYSHTEGTATFAINRSHAEGHNTHAEGYSHAEGKKVKAIDNSHAEGFLTEAKNRSHAEGVNTKANGFNSHAEGNNTQTIGSVSHAEGYYNIAYGNQSHVGGEYNVTGSKEGKITIEDNGISYDISVGTSCFAHGYDCLAFRNYTFTLGCHLRANYEEQFIIGQYNRNYEDSIFEIGNGDGPDDLVFNGKDFGQSSEETPSFSPSNAFRVTKEGVAIAQKDFQLEDGTSFKTFTQGQSLIPQPQKKESFLFSENGKWVEKDFKTILLNYLINAEEVSY